MREPKTYNKTVNNLIYGNKQKAVIDEKLQNIDFYQTQYYTILLPNQKSINYKQIFKVKYNPNRSIKKNKARLIAQSFLQVYGIDFTKTFMLAIRQESLQIFPTIAIILYMILLQMDIIDAYLKGFFNKNNQLIYMKILQRYIIK